METIKNVTQLLVAKDISSDSIAAGTVVTTSNLSDGAVVVTDLAGKAVTTASSVTAFKLVQNSGGTLVWSDVIAQGKVRAYNVTAYSEEVQQTDYIGYNTSSGSLDTTANNIFTVRLYIKDNTVAGFMQQKIKEGFYKSGSSVTQADVALGLVKSLVANYSREPEEDIKFARVNSANDELFGDSVGSLTFTKGSKYFTAGDIDDATTNAAIAVGDYIRIAHADKTAPVYKVVSIDATNNIGELDMEFQETSCTLASDTACAIIRAANVGDFGIEIYGVDREFVVGKFASRVAQWKTTIDFGDGASAEVTEDTGADPGIGTYQQVAQLEKELQADEYVFRAFPEGAPVDRADALSTETYDMLVLEFDDVTQSGQGVDVHSPKTLIIATATKAAQADVGTYGFVTVMDDFLVTDWATPGASAQAGNLTA